MERGKVDGVELGKMEWGEVGRSELRPTTPHLTPHALLTPTSRFTPPHFDSPDVEPSHLNPRPNSTPLLPALTTPTPTNLLNLIRNEYKME